MTDADPGEDFRLCFTDLPWATFVTLDDFDEFHADDLDMLGLISRNKIVTPEGRKFEYRIDTLRAGILLESLQSLEVPGVPSDASLIPTALHDLIIDED